MAEKKHLPVAEFPPKKDMFRTYSTNIKKLRFH